MNSQLKTITIALTLLLAAMPIGGCVQNTAIKTDKPDASQATTEPVATETAQTDKQQTQTQESESAKEDDSAAGNRLPESIEQAQAQLAKARESGEDRQLLHALRQTMRMYKRSAEWDKAEKYAVEHRALVKRRHGLDSRNYVISSVALADIYYQSNRYKEAQDIFEYAIKHAPTDDFHADVKNDWLVRLAWCQRENGQLDDAVKSAGTAAKSLGSKFRNVALVELGVFAIDRGDEALARKYADQINRNSSQPMATRMLQRLKRKLDNEKNGPQQLFVIDQLARLASS